MRDMMNWSGDHARNDGTAITIEVWYIVSDYGVIRDGAGQVVLVGPKYVYPDPFPGFFEQMEGTK